MSFLVHQFLIPLCLLAAIMCFLSILNSPCNFISLVNESTSKTDHLKRISVPNHLMDDDITTTGHKNINEEASPGECQMYLAPSSIPHSGLGLFTARSIKSDDIIQDSDSPGIPLIDKFWPNLVEDMALFTDKSWPEDRGVFDHMRFEAESVVEVSCNLGAFPNYHPYLVNIHLMPHPNEFDDTIVDRYESPGAGAFSEYMGKSYYARRDIQPGEELFLHYGNAKEYLKHIPGPDDYDKAGEILRALKHELELLKDEDLETRGGGLVVDDAERLRDMLGYLHAVVPLFSTRVDELLPSTLSELRALVDASSHKLREEDLSFAAARTVATKYRTVSWLRKNGMCLDHIIPQKSTVPHAGRGAFAQRGIKKGGMVVPVPLLHIANRKVLGTYKVYRDDEGRLVRNDGAYEGSQLLLNYCFAHKESTLLLCPESNGVYVNHCSEREKDKCGGKGPNVAYRWAKGWDDTQKWLKASYQDVVSEQLTRVVSLEFIATRNIEEGEELFMDYGIEWEQAWDKHVKNWKPSEDPDIDPYKPIKIINEQHNYPLQFSDIRNETSPYEQFMTGCYYYESHSHYAAPGSKRWKKWSDERIIKNFAHKARYTYNSIRDWGDFWPCTIIAKDDPPSNAVDKDEDYYTVRIFQLKTYSPASWHKNGIPCIVTQLPRTSIKFFNKPYRSNLHLPNAFRHPIGIREEIFPEQWKNLKTETTENEYDVGDRVAVNWEKKGDYYDGHVTKVKTAKKKKGEEGWGGVRYDVLYDDGGSERDVMAKDVKDPEDSILVEVDLDPIYA